MKCETLVLLCGVVVHLVLLVAVSSVNSEWQKCFDAADLSMLKFLGLIYVYSSSVSCLLAVEQVVTGEDSIHYYRRTGFCWALISCVIQFAYGVFFAFASTQICGNASDVALAFWIILGVVQAAYFACTVFRLCNVWE